MIPLATFRKDDKPNGELYRLLWEPRTGVVWVRRSFGGPRSWPTLYYARRRFAVDAMIADVYGGRFPKTFKPISRRPPKAVSPSRRANSVSAPVDRDGIAQPPNKEEPR